MAVLSRAPGLDLAAVLVELSELGPPSEIRRQAPALASRTLALDRVLLSSVSSGELHAEALHLTAGADPAPTLELLRAHPVALSYPLIEGEIVRRRRAQLVDVRTEAACAFAGVLGWRRYVTAPIVLDGRAVGFLHGDRAAGPAELTEADAAALAAFAVAFGVVFDRAALRLRLRSQREEMRRIAAWAAARTAALSERELALDGGAEPQAGTAAHTAGAHGAHDPLRELLTRRELEVLELMVRGETNASIARDLVLSTGTVKFHVKNILRKLHAANRAEATSRYMRITLGR